MVKQFYGPKKLADTLDAVTHSAFIKKGFHERKIITDWELIVGEQFSYYTCPRKLTLHTRTNEGILYIECYTSSIALQISYMEPLIIEKIATYFGYRAVSKLRIIQKPLSVRSTSPVLSKTPIASLPTHIQSNLTHLLQDIDDPDLKEQLHTLGRSIFSTS